MELIHAYSLVHDDLPAMDDDDLRRGQPTTHKAFDEACAILAGDGLQSLAFSALLDARLSPQDDATRLAMVQALAKAAGPAGMVGGQAIDLGSVGLKLDQRALEYMHRHKTGALIEASVRLGALASARASQAQLEALQRYAQAIGLAFRCRTTFSTWRATPPPSVNARGRYRPRQTDLPGPARPGSGQGLRARAARPGAGSTRRLR